MQRLVVEVEAPIRHNEAGASLRVKICICVGKCLFRMKEKEDISF